MSRPIVSDSDVRESEHGTSILLIGLALSMGIFTVIGHEQRWAAPAYKMALMVPGAPESWGWALIALSVFTVYGYYNSHRNVGFGVDAARPGFWFLVAGFFLMGMWWLFFGITFFVQFIDNSAVSINGALVEFMLTLMCIQKSMLYWRGLR